MNALAAGLVAALTLAVAAAPGTARGENLPGVRGTVFQSPSFGFVVFWDADAWTATDATSAAGYDTLTLEGNGQLVTVEAWPSDPSSHLEPAACQQDRLAGIAADPGIIELEPAQPAAEDVPPFDARWEARWAPDGLTGQALVIGISCRERGLDDGVTIRETRMHSRSPDEATPGSWPASFSGYALGFAPPGPGAMVNLRVFPRQEIEAGVVSVRIDIENLDAAAARFDASRLFVYRENLPAAGVSRWRLLQSPAPARGPVYSLAPGERLSIEATFVAEGRLAGLGYRDPAGGELLLECWWGCGGAGLAPIIRISD